MPNCSKISCKSARIDWSSSIITAFRPSKEMFSFGMVFVKILSEFFSGRVKIKLLPSPKTLSTIRLPPKSSVSFFEIANPKPLPPNLWAISVSACVNSLKISCCFSSEMPIPVSITEIFILEIFGTLSAVEVSSSSTLISTLPVSVNLKALPTKLFIICRIRRGSLSKILLLISCEMENFKSTAFCRNCCFTAFPASMIIFSKEKGTLSMGNFPASNLEKSSKSSTKCDIKCELEVICPK